MDNSFQALAEIRVESPCPVIHKNRFMPVAGGVLFFPLLIFSCSRCSLPEGNGEGREGPKRITVITYNAENIFDDIDNGSEYREYDPGEGKWTTELYHSRLSNLADVLSAVPPKGPDIAALQEIENLEVLTDLRDMYTNQLGLKYVACPEAAGSAVNTAIMSRYPITEVHAHCVGARDGEGLRYILEAHVLAEGCELIIINNHWKSKSGGTAETEPLRRLAAGLVRRRLSELAASDPDSDVLILGDFNENYDEYERIGNAYPTALMPMGDTGGDYSTDALVLTGNPEEAIAADGRIRLYTVWADMETPGSYVYREQWETLDNVLCMPGLFNDTGFTFTKARVLDAAFLLDAGGYPLPWNKDSRQGYSDHLPLLVNLEVCTR